MLVLFLASVLLAVSDDPATSLLQTTPQAAAGGTIAKLSPSEVSDLQKRADSGEASAQFLLGKAYESGNGVPKRSDQAAIWYRKAAEQGNMKAQNSLGVLYWLGEGVERDKSEAVRWYRKAARRGDASAMFNVGAAYYNGEGVGVNDTLAYAWFLLSSEAGNSSGRDASERSQNEHPNMFGDACLKVGGMYERGEDLPKDLPLAAAWYQKAEQRGSKEAVVSLAGLYLRANDFSQARHWCEKGAKEKLPDGYFCLGYLYQRGLGVEQNLKEAFRCYEQAAKEFHTPSMLILAQMYEKGEGTKSDRSQAFVWFLLGAWRGNHDALLEARRLRSSMTEQEWKSTKKKLPPTFDLKVDAILQHGRKPATP